VILATSQAQAVPSPWRSGWIRGSRPLLPGGSGAPRSTARMCPRSITGSSPGLGKHRLDRLTPEHVERFYARLEADGLAAATILQIHRILSRALKVAVQRGYLARNVTELVDAPTVTSTEPLTLAEARSCRVRDEASRWYPMERGPGPGSTPGRSPWPVLAEC